MTGWPAWDLALFHLVNGRCHTPLLDRLMPVVTNALLLAPLVAILLALLILRHRQFGVRVALAALLAVGVSDLLTAQVLKPAWHRPRPCREGGEVRLLVRCGGRNGFPSNHAANSGAIAAAVGVLLPGTLPLTLPVALVVAWSRVYVGVHYPLDVAAGLLFGGLVGGALGMAFRRGTRGAPPPNGAKCAGPIAEGRDLH